MSKTIFDLFRERRIDISENKGVLKFDTDNEILTIKYPSGFTWELRGIDFPNRDLIPCYTVVNGKYYIDHYEREGVKAPSFVLSEVVEGVNA